MSHIGQCTRTEAELAISFGSDIITAAPVILAFGPTLSHRSRHVAIPHPERAASPPSVDRRDRAGRGRPSWQSGCLSLAAPFTCQQCSQPELTVDGRTAAQLIQALSDPDPDVRRHAADDLGKMNIHATKALPDLLGLVAQRSRRRCADHRHRRGQENVSTEWHGCGQGPVCRRRAERFDGGLLRPRPTGPDGGRRRASQSETACGSGGAGPASWPPPTRQRHEFGRLPSHSPQSGVAWPW